MTTRQEAKDKSLATPGKKFYVIEGSEDSFVGTAPLPGWSAFFLDGSETRNPKQGVHFPPTNTLSVDMAKTKKKGKPAAKAAAGSKADPASTDTTTKSPVEKKEKKPSMSTSEKEKAGLITRQMITFNETDPDEKGIIASAKKSLKKGESLNSFLKGLIIKGMK